MFGDPRDNEKEIYIYIYSTFVFVQGWACISNNAHNTKINPQDRFKSFSIILRPYHILVCSILNVSYSYRDVRDACVVIVKRAKRGLR